MKKNLKTIIFFLLLAGSLYSQGEKQVIIDLLATEAKASNVTVFFSLSNRTKP